MDCFTVERTTRFRNAILGDGVLRAGTTYFAYSQFAREVVQGGVGVLNPSKRGAILSLEKGHLPLLGNEIGKVLLLFAGGLGDAIMLGTVLPSIEESRGIDFDICSSVQKWRDVFVPMGFKGSWVSYPPSLSMLGGYDAVLTDITQFYSKGGRSHSPIRKLSEGFGIDPGRIPHRMYAVDPQVKQKMALGKTGAVRVGLHLDSNGAVKSYPKQLYSPLLKHLAECGLEVYLLGNCPKDEVTVSKNGLRDYRGRTTIPELAAILEQMDVILGVDSFVVNLGNVVNKNVLALLSTTSRSFFSEHRHVECLESQIECARCLEAFNHCPRGNEECLAFYHPSISRNRIVGAVMKQIRSRFQSMLVGKDNQWPEVSNL